MFNKVKNNVLSSKLVMLVILDGFGFRKDEYFNGVLVSHMTNYFSYWNTFPHTKLNASGPKVGLPEGQIGSSEVGHMSLGAGRLIKQPIVRINEEIKNKDFFKNSYLKSSLIFLKRKSGNIHIMGLLSNGGVHSSIEHLFAVLDFYNQNIDKFLGNIYIHNFLDGRDTAQKSALIFLNQLEDKINSFKNSNRFKIASFCGRYYAMDRDLRWERTEKAYDLVVNGVGKSFSNYKLGLDYFYSKNITDEFILPSKFLDFKINSNDLILFYNFRTDRPKQLVEAILDEKFNNFKTRNNLKNIKFYTLTDYLINGLSNKIKVLYGTIYPKDTLGEVLSKNNLTQLRIAESEKFPHVTYFFSGLRNDLFKGEKRIKVLSPRVATYDLKPEMSAEEVTYKVINAIKSEEFNFILLNFANSDMVGHTGNFEAVIKALNKVDSCLGRIKSNLDEVGGTLLITADHGNCETMRDEKGNPHTKHTYNMVPFILCDNNYMLRNDYENLSLTNVAPTILDLFGLDKPKSWNDSKSIIYKE